MNVPVTVSASAAGRTTSGPPLWCVKSSRDPDLLQQRILRFFRILRLFRLRSSCVRILRIGILRIRVFRIRLFRFAQAYGYLDPGDGVGGRVEDVRIVAAGRECGQGQECRGDRRPDTRNRIRMAKEVPHNLDFVIMRFRFGQAARPMCTSNLSQSLLAIKYAHAKIHTLLEKYGMTHAVLFRTA